MNGFFSVQTFSLAAPNICLPYLAWDLVYFCPPNFIFPGLKRRGRPDSELAKRHAFFGISLFLFFFLLKIHGIKSQVLFKDLTAPEGHCCFYRTFWWLLLQFKVWQFFGIPAGRGGRRSGFHTQGKTVQTQGQYPVPLSCSVEIEGSGAGGEEKVAWALDSPVLDQADGPRALCRKKLRKRKQFSKHNIVVTSITKQTKSVQMLWELCLMPIKKNRSPKWDTLWLQRGEECKGDVCPLFSFRPVVSGDLGEGDIGMRKTSY